MGTMRVAKQLAPLSVHLHPDVRTLAQALRDLFAAVDVSSVRAYAARRHVDPATVTRSLNGSTVPTWTFVEDLAQDARLPAGLSASESTMFPSIDPMKMMELKDLYRAALQANDSRRARIGLLEDRLAQADEDVRAAAVREAVLTRELESTRAWGESLADQVRALEGGHVRALPGSSRAELSLAKDEEQLRREYRDAQQKIADLIEKLNAERKLRLEAEELCAHLEQRLAEVDDITEPVDEDAKTASTRVRLLIEGTDHGRQIAELEDQRMQLHLRIGDLSDTCTQLRRLCDQHQTDLSAAKTELGLELNRRLRLQDELSLALSKLAASSEPTVASARGFATVPFASPSRTADPAPEQNPLAVAGGPRTYGSGRGPSQDQTRAEYEKPAARTGTE